MTLIFFKYNGSVFNIIHDLLTFFGECFQRYLVFIFNHLFLNYLQNYSYFVISISHQHCAIFQMEYNTFDKVISYKYNGVIQIKR